MVDPYPIGVSQPVGCDTVNLLKFVFNLNIN